MSRLHEIVQRLTPALVSVAFLSTDRPVSGVVLLDPVSPEPVGDEQLVLAVGVAEGDAATELVRQGMGCALFVRSAAVTSTLTEAARAADLSLLVVPDDMPWLHLLTLLQSALDPPGVSAVDDDLFSVANSVAAMVGGPVTIEDPQSHLLAFSGHQDVVDAARIATILGRQAPREHLDRMREYGVFQRLYGAADPIHVPGRPPDILPRAAVAIRAGDEILGSIWVAIAEPLGAPQREALTQAAAMTALHLLRRRAAADYGRRSRQELLGRLLSGRADAASDWPSSAPAAYRAITVDVRHAGGEGDDEWTRQRIAEALQTHLAGAVRRAVTGLVDGRVYAVTASPETAASTMLGLLTNFVSRFATARGHVLTIGVGLPVRRLTELPDSRRQADLAHRVADQRRNGSAVTDFEQVAAEALLLHISDNFSQEPWTDVSAVRRIEAYDGEHQTRLAATLRTWLDCHGDAEVAARLLGVHTNTVRNRIKQLGAQSLLDVTDPVQRLVAQLHLFSRREDPA